MRPPSHRIVLAIVLALALLVGACGDDDTSAPTTDAGPITVFAAASLTDAFQAVGDAFEAANPGIVVTFNFAGSSTLREQVLAGAPADVFASANMANMDQVIDGGEATNSVPFTTNSLTIAVGAGNPAGVEGLDDFADGSLLLGLCADAVPCGSFGREALANAGVTPDVDTEEPDVRALLTKIASGDLDAGIVYVTDVASVDGDVDAVAIPDDVNVTATYPIAVLRGASAPGTAQSFVDFVLSAEGQAIMASFGFGPP